MNQEIDEEKQKLVDISDFAKAKIEELGKGIDDQIKKVEKITKENPGIALGMTFLAGAAIGGVIILLLSRDRKRD